MPEASSNALFAAAKSKLYALVNPSSVAARIRSFTAAGRGSAVSTQWNKRKATRMNERRFIHLKLKKFGERSNRLGPNEGKRYLGGERRRKRFPSIEELMVEGNLYPGSANTSRFSITSTSASSSSR